MTLEERINELERLRDAKGGEVTDRSKYEYRTMSDFHQHVTEIMQRDVWTHELASTTWDMLIDELKSGREATFEDVINKVPQEKRIIVVVPDQ
jgi:hypothetical protein